MKSPEKLSAQAESAFFNAENALYLSAASYWEICIKHAIRKITLTENWKQRFDEEVAVNQILWLPIEKEHCQALTELPMVHKDPFDRILIAQARFEGMALLTADEQIQKYEVPTLW
jgi:PIN domain nuclease of toxin-antitoxin system